MNWKSLERIIGMVCIIIGYGIAASQGHDGMLFTIVVSFLSSIVVGKAAYEAGLRGGNAGPVPNI